MNSSLHALVLSSVLASRLGVAVGTLVHIDMPYLHLELLCVAGVCLGSILSDRRSVSLSNRHAFFSLLLALVAQGSRVIQRKLQRVQTAQR